MPDALCLHCVLVSFFQGHGDGDRALHGALGGDLDEVVPRRRQGAVEVDGVEGDGVIGGGVVDVEDAEDAGFVSNGAPVEEGQRDGREDYLEVRHVAHFVVEKKVIAVCLDADAG